MRAPSPPALLRLVLSLTALLFACSGSPDPAPAAPEVADSQDASVAADPAPASADAPPDAPTDAGDDSPALDQLTWLLEVLNERQGVIASDEGEARFAPEFLASVPLIALVEGLEGWSLTYGPFELVATHEGPEGLSVEADARGRYGAGWRVELHVEALEPYRISGLSISAGALPWNEAEAVAASLAEGAHIYAAELSDEGCDEVHALAGETRYALASVFKLYVLYALHREVEAGALSWDDALAVRDDWKSNPDGDVYDEAAGTALSLKTYADKMIAISDNSATDHLLYHLGRQTVEGYLADAGHTDPSVNIPFLGTAEAFKLKLNLDDDALAAYLALDEPAQAAFLDEEVSQMPLFPPGATWTSPLRIDTIEWFATGPELCALMRELRAAGDTVLDVMSINPGIALDPSVWPYMGFKGGSELGVSTFTWLLERADDRWFVLALGLNDSAADVDLDGAIALAASMSQTLAALP